MEDSQSDKPSPEPGPPRPEAPPDAFPPILLAGPTAVGKSAIALALAERIGGEIVTVDSMQVYRGLDIGTAKPTPEERQRVPHHLIDILELDQAFDAAQFVQRARAAVAEIQARAHFPILCGGTGLYFKAFLEGLTETPPADPELRRQLEATSLEELLRELEQRDPEGFARLDRRNPRRVRRALEVIRLTGQPFFPRRTQWRPDAAAASRDAGALFFCFSRTSEDLRRRIELRVEQMFRLGLVAETARLLERGLGENQTAMQALGYRQVVEHLRGACALPETIERVKARTRQFARRQMTWFRRQAEPRGIALEASQEPAEVVESLLAQTGGLGGHRPAQSRPEILPAAKHLRR